MNQNSGGTTCTISCWLIALLGGILIAAMLMNLAGFSFIAAAFWGLVALVLGGLILTWAFCRGSEATINSARSGADARDNKAGLVATGAVAAGAAAASAATSKQATPAAAPEPTAAPAPKPAAAPAPVAAAEVKASARLAGEEDLAGRKGEWKYDGGDDAAAKAKADADAAARAKAKADADAAARAKADADAAAAKAKADADAAAAKAKAEADAAAKKQADEAAAAARARVDADMARSSRVAATPSADPAAAAEGKPVAADGKPELLTAARAGGPDDLKQIKGGGNVMEDMLHAMGVFHFDQVASWRPAEIDWVDANLPKFKGRVKRDNWVDQAKILAAGGETEFSKKVEKGGVSYKK